MARDFSREPYRKLLERPSASFRSLDVLTQGLGYVLIREAELETGRLNPITSNRKSTVAALARRLGADPRERRLVTHRIELLLADGFLVERDGFIVVRNLSTVNERREQKSTAPTVRRLSVGETSTEHRRDIDETSTAPPRSAGEASAERRRDTEIDLSARNHVAPLAHARTNQVGSIGRKIRKSNNRTACPAAIDTSVPEFVEKWELDPDHPELARFLDHHRSKGNLMADWSAAWRTWLKNAAVFQQRSGGTTVASSSATPRAVGSRGFFPE